MPIEQKRFSGILNKDDALELVLANQHIDALNIRLYGGAQGLTAQNIPGNTLITNILPAGDNQCLGSCYDSVHQRVFWQNWNSNARNGLYMYDLNTGLITPLLISFTNSQADIFGFDLDFPIASQNIIYTTEADGDIWTWTARNGRPKELNIKDAINNIFGANWLAEYLDVAKQPPTIPPACAYENDITSIVNNLKNKLYRFKYRFVYGTFQKSTWSSISKMPIPFNYTDQVIDTDQTKNCRIGLIFQTGEADVVKIEIAAQENLGVGWGNFFSVQILDKAELSIPNNDTYIWAFYNNEAYDYIDLNESNLLFDYVPNKANTQELLNGNVIIYGGITEGYDPVIPEVTIAVQPDAIGGVGYPIASMVTQQSHNGVFTGDIRISLVGLPAFAALGVGSEIRVTIQVGSTTYFINAVTGLITTDIADMIAQLIASATGFGFSIVSSTANSVVINQPTQVLLYSFCFGNGDNLKALNQSVPANEFSSKENFAIGYFAEKSKTNGATTSENFVGNITPINFNPTDAAVFDLTQVQMTIANRPPLWAKYWMPLRSNNLTKSSFLSWVSDRTFKDDQFAYISIESINVYKIQHETSIISYDFLAGDRIKFCALFNSNKSIAQDYGNAHDYELVGQIENPIINGLLQNGQFLKINVPTTSVSFDFGNFLSNAFYFYYIELYTPAKSVANNLNIYYEIGEMFEVGNAGTITAFHQGNAQNQTPDLITPAICIFRGGDSWYRLREVRAGAFFKADLTKDITYVWWNEPVVVLTVENIPVGTSYEVKDTISVSTLPSNWLIKTGLSAVNFNIKGTLSFVALSNTSNILIVYLQIKNAISGAITSLVELIRIVTGATSGQILEFKIDANVTIPAGQTAVPYLQESPVGTPVFSANSISGVLTFIDTEHDFTIGVIDQNFSDFIESKVNSNGRTSIVQPDEKELFYPTLVRWGLSYQQNTNINQINRFFPANFDEIDRSKGDIQRFKTRDRILRVFQNRACGQYGVLARFIQNNDGDNQLVTTDEIITRGNISYYAGEFGVGDQYTALVSSKNVDYFDDSVRGYECRLSNDGIIPISELYKGEFVIRNYILPYNKTYPRPGGGKAKILKTYNYFDEEAITLLQFGGNDHDGIVPGYCFSFNEKRNGYCTFHSFKKAEWLQDFEDKIAMWKDGQLWVLDIGNPDPSTPYCNYFGEQFDTYIDLVFNANLLEVKTYESVGEIASAIWSCPLIYTSTESYPGQRQESELIESDFANLEGQFKTAFLRDIKSQEGLLNGSWLKGSYIVIRFQISNASNLVTLSQITVMYKESPLNEK